MTTGDHDTGISDPTRATDWLLARCPELLAPLDFDLIEAGRSNLTYRVTDVDGRAVVLRRPPLGPVAPSAHDMRREYSIIAGLATSDVPVPRPRSYCDDPSVIGAPFHVMDFVAGRVLRTEADCAGLPSEVVVAATNNLVTTMAELHRVLPHRVGLGGIGRRDGYIARQLRRWNTQYNASTGDHLVPLMHQVHEELSGAVPPAQAVALVHGDYRLDNVILGPAGEVLAVLDWELCTLGDPLADLGMLLTYWASPDGAPAPVPTATGAPGFPDRRALVERYAAASPLDLSDVGFYVAFAHWKVACILDGVYERYEAGGGGGSEESVDHYPELIDSLAGRAHDILAGTLDSTRSR